MPAPQSGVGSGRPPVEVTIGDEEPTSVQHVPERVPSEIPRPASDQVIDKEEARGLLARLKTFSSAERLSPIDRDKAAIRVLAKILGPTLGFINDYGSGSKTTTATYFGNFLADITRRPVFVLPATGNLRTAAAGLIAGINPEDDPLDILKFLSMWQEMKSYHAISRHIPVTSKGAHIVSEPFDSVVGIRDTFGVMDWLNVFEPTKAAAMATLLDFGNDDVKEGSIVLGAFRQVHVPVFTATADIMKTLVRLSKVINTYASDDWTRELDEDETKLLNPLKIPSREKALKGVVIISKVRRGQGPEDFMKYLEDIPDFEGTIVTIPRDRYIERNVVSDIERIHPNTQRAYIRALLTCLRSAAELAGLELSSLPQLAEK